MQVNDVKFKEAETTISTTEEGDFHGICVWTKCVDRRDWMTSLDRKTCVAMPAAVDEGYSPRPSKRSRLRTRGNISTFWHYRDQSNPRTASQRWRLGSRTNSRTQVNNVKFEEEVTMSSTTEERDFRGMCVWRKRVDRRDWGTSLDRKTYAAMPATVTAVEDMIVLFGRQGRDIMGRSCSNETRMTCLLSQVHSLSTIGHFTAKNFSQTSLRPTT